MMRIALAALIAAVFVSEAAAQRTVESLEYAGCTFPSGNIDDLAGLGDRECSIVVEHKTNDRTGKTYAEIKWINAASSGGVRARGVASGAA